MRQSKLIILRGPSGSGKTTTAKRLFDESKNRTALIEQDYYRFIFNPPGGGKKPNSDTIHKMIKSDVLIALEDGYDVILEGILSVKAYAKVLDEIFKSHQKENYMFYFDVSFKETVKRHLIRQNLATTKISESQNILDEKRAKRLQDFGEDDMRAWYSAAHKSNHKLENIISETSSIEETLAYIKKVSKL